MRSADFHKGLKSLPRTRFIAEVFQIWATRCLSVSWRVVTIWATLWATPERLGHSGGAEEKVSRRLGAGSAPHAETRTDKREAVGCIAAASCCAGGGADNTALRHLAPENRYKSA